MVPWTIIKKWHEAGTYVPYETDALYEMLMQVRAWVEHSCRALLTMSM